MPFVRFSIQTRHPESGEPRGLFSALYRLEGRKELDDHELMWFREQEAWFNKHVPVPDRFARSKRPGAARLAILWFRDTATEAVSRMHALAALLEAKGILVDIATTDRPGYLVYEDAVQVAAEPFHGQN